MAQRNAGARLAQAVSDIFGARIRVEMTVAGDREERLRKLQEQRRETVLTVTREEMEKRAAAETENHEKADPAPAEKKTRVRKAQNPGEPAEAASVGKPILGRGIGTGRWRSGN